MQSVVQASNPLLCGATVLVTGGAGFIGSNFVHYWVREVGGRVINLDKLTYAGHPASLAPLNGDSRHVFVQGDIGDRELVSRLLREHAPVAIINFAAESHVDRSIHGPEEFVMTNVVGTFRLLEEVRAYVANLHGALRSVFRFVHVSTDEVYGSLSATAPAFTEATPYAPNSPYSATKAASDHLVRAYHHTYGLPTLTTNCSNNYGPLQFPEKLIPLMILNALRDKPLPVYGDGFNVRDWLYVRDHCTAIHRVLEAGRVGETYNIGGQSEQKNIDVVHTICSVLDEVCPSAQRKSYRELIKHVTDRPGHDRRYAMDISKINRELSWSPAETFASGIRKTVHWYLDNTVWLDQVTKGGYGNWNNLNYGSHRA